jgi:hypothetical protein
VGRGRGEKGWGHLLDPPLHGSLHSISKGTQTGGSRPSRFPRPSLRSPSAIFDLAIQILKRAQGMGRGQDRKDEKRKCTSNDTPWKAWRCFFLFFPSRTPLRLSLALTSRCGRIHHHLRHSIIGVWGTICAAKDGENCELGIDTGREAGKDSNRSRLQGMELHPG